ncbi:DNA-3-methyladenine glycosylase 2 family protein [Kitasatospora sp. NPDC051914]|uniref:DNA-3-methyladenine glycosylase family protein n=1 Tax=Kitasatospora sp. NPDC051914 TaxID=3154945 RepID=UPI0034336898
MAVRAMDGAARTRTWCPPYPLDLAAVVSPLRRGAGDPTIRVETGVVWRASRTPAGLGTLRIMARPADGAVAATAWGPGADWLLEQMPAMLGANDQPDGLVLPPGKLRDVQRRNPGLRLGATALVMDALVPAVLEQKVTVTEAHCGWRTLLRRYGTPAPGPGAELGLMVPPSAREWALVPSWTWHRAGVDAKRAETILRAVRLAPRLEEASAMAGPEAAARLTHVPGIGPWTAAETLQRCNGDPDAVSVGDLHLPNTVVWALAGKARGTDEEMLELLAPYAGHRHRVCRLIRALGVRAPRFGPRPAPNGHRRR